MGCYENLKDEFLKSMSEHEIKDVLNDLKAMREKMGLQDSTISLADRMKEYTDAQSEAKRMKAQEAERAALINAKVHNKTVNQVLAGKGQKGWSAYDGIKSLLGGTEKPLRMGNYSIENIRNSKAVGMLSDIKNALYKLGYKDKYMQQLEKDPKFGDKVAKEIGAMEEGKETKSVTGDPDAFNYAKVYAPQIEKIRVMKNDLGANEAKVKGYVANQSYSGPDVRALGKTQPDAEKAFFDLVMPHLDHEATFGNDNPVKFLKYNYDSITTGEHGLDFKWGTGRKLIFKSVEDWIAVNKVIGTNKDTLHAIHQSLISGLHDVALLEKLGTNPKAMFDRILNEFRSSERKSEIPNVGKDLAYKLERDFKAVTGELFQSIKPKISWISKVLQVQANLAHLGTVMWSSINDIPMSAINLTHNGIGFFDAYHQIFKGFAKQSPEMKQIVGRLIGEFADGEAHSGIARYSSINQRPGIMSKGMALFSKLSGIDWETRTMRAGNARALSLHLAHQMNDTWATMDKSIQSTLTRYGILEKDWNIIRQSKVKLENGNEYITPDAIRDIPKEAFGDMGKREIADYKKELEDKLGSVFVSEINYGVVSPGLKERAKYGGIQRGTPWGEAQHLMMQFKWFPTRVVEKVGPR